MAYRPASHRTPYHRPISSSVRLPLPEARPQHEGGDHFLRAGIRSAATLAPIGLSSGMLAAARRGRSGQNPWRQNYSAAY